MRAILLTVLLACTIQFYIGPDGRQQTCVVCCDHGSCLVTCP
jgi:hypothetical protein